MTAGLDPDGYPWPGDTSLAAQDARKVIDRHQGRHQLPGGAEGLVEAARALGVPVVAPTVRPRTMLWTRLLARLVDLVPLANLDGLPVVVVTTARETQPLQAGPGCGAGDGHGALLPVTRVVYNRRQSRIELHTSGPVDCD